MGFNEVFSFIISGKLWLGLIVGYILGKYMNKEIEKAITSFFSKDEKEKRRFNRTERRYQE